MNSGLLDRKIQIFRNTPVESESTGELEDCWQVHLTRRARKIETAGKEYLSNAREIGKHSVIFRIRYTEDIGTGDRVFHYEKYYDIEDFIEIGRREWTDVICTLRHNQ